MPPAVSLLLLVSLLRKTYFTAIEARERGVPPSALNHYVKTSRIKRVSRGVYQGREYNNPSASIYDMVLLDHDGAGHVVEGTGNEGILGIQKFKADFVGSLREAVNIVGLP